MKAFARLSGPLRSPPRGVLGAVAAAAIVACAGAPPPLPIRAHLPARVPADVSPERPRLGVGRFVDARPRGDHVRRRPLLRVRWYGLERTGESQTGDESFEGDVARGVRLDAIATLVRSGAFSEVRPLEVGDEAAAAAVQEGVVDVVLTATVEELVGVRREDLRVSFFLLGGIWSRADPPVGLARVRYRAYGGEGLLFDESIDTLHRSEGRTPAQAALDAVARTNERAASRLFHLLVPESKRLRRSLPLRVVDRCRLGRDRVEHLISEASEVFEREAGVRLRPEWAARESDPFPGLEAALGEARSERPPPGGAVLWLVHVQRLSGRVPFGLSVPLGEHAVVACRSEGDVRVVTLAHEIAHLFGAVHVEARASVMHPVAEFDGRFFDPLNRWIVNAAWDRPFGEPLPVATRERLEAAYRQALRFSRGIDPGEIRALLASGRPPGAPPRDP